MSYGLGDASDERRASALEAQAADIEKVATSLEADQPSAALALRTQAVGMKQQASAFRAASGLPPAGSMSTSVKIALAVGLLPLAAVTYWIAGPGTNFWKWMTAPREN